MGYKIRSVPVTKNEARFTDVCCDDCGDAFEPVFRGQVDDAGTWESLQVLDGLHIRFDGGYGELIDPVDEPAPTAILCRSCVLRLAAAHPFIARMLTPHLGADLGAG